MSEEGIEQAPRESYGVQSLLELEDTLCARHKLSLRETEFVKIWVERAGDKGLISAAEAVKLAGFSTPRSTQNSLRVAGHKLLKRPNVRAAISEYQRKRAGRIDPDLAEKVTLWAIKTASGLEPVRQSFHRWDEEGELVVEHRWVYDGSASSMRQVAAQCSTMAGTDKSKIELSGPNGTALSAPDTEQVTKLAALLDRIEQRAEKQADDGR